MTAVLKNDNNKIVELDKVAYVYSYWSNWEDSLHIKSKPKVPTIGGASFNPHAYAIPMLIEYPLETNLERAFRLGLLDIWIPCCVLQLSNGHSLRYTGKKALAIDRAWKSKVFGN